LLLGACKLEARNPEVVGKFTKKEAEEEDRERGARRLARNSVTCRHSVLPANHYARRGSHKTRVAAAPTVPRSTRGSRSVVHNHWTEPSLPRRHRKTRDNGELYAGSMRVEAELKGPWPAGRTYPQALPTTTIWRSGDAFQLVVPQQVTGERCEQNRSEEGEWSTNTGETGFRPVSPKRTPGKTYRPTMSPFKLEIALSTSFFSLSGTLNLSRVAVRAFTLFCQSSSVMCSPVCAVFMSRPV
jgi:hypothetical protein